MKFPCLVTVAGLLLAAAGCTESRVEALDLVPDDAVVALHVRCPEAMASEDLRTLTSLPPWLNELAVHGVPVSHLESITIFSKVFSEPANEVAILSAPGIGKAFSAIANAGHGWRVEQIGTGRLYVLDSSAGFAVATVGDHIVMAGPGTEMRGLIRPAGLRAAFTAKPAFALVRDALRDSSAVHLAVAWPNDVLDASKTAVAATAGLLKFAGSSTIGSVVEKLGIGRAYLVRLIPQSNGVNFNIAGVMQDEATATMVAGSANLMKTLSGWVPTTARPGQPDVLQTMTVERTGSVVWIGVSIPRESKR